jgi:hypothetical protein
VVPCRAGQLSGVVYANGDVSLCEIHKPIGNLRKNTFPEIWHSEEAKKLRESIARKDCYCTTEVFMWSSITYSPVQLTRAMVAGKVWRKPLPLLPQDRAPVTLADGPPMAPVAEPDPVESVDTLN